MVFSRSVFIHCSKRFCDFCLHLLLWVYHAAGLPFSKKLMTFPPSVSVASMTWCNSQILLIPWAQSKEMWRVAVSTLPKLCVIEQCMENNLVVRGSNQSQIFLVAIYIYKFIGDHSNYKSWVKACSDSYNCELAQSSAFCMCTCAALPHIQHSTKNATNEKK